MFIHFLAYDRKAVLFFIESLAITFSSNITPATIQK